MAKTQSSFFNVFNPAGQSDPKLAIVFSVAQKCGESKAGSNSIACRGDASAAAPVVSSIHGSQGEQNDKDEERGW